MSPLIVPPVKKSEKEMKDSENHESSNSAPCLLHAVSYAYLYSLHLGGGWTGKPTKNRRQFYQMWVGKGSICLCSIHMFSSGPWQVSKEKRMYSLLSGLTRVDCPASVRIETMVVSNKKQKKSYIKKKVQKKTKSVCQVVGRTK